MNWTTAEVKAVTAANSALVAAGFVDGRDSNATPASNLYFRDFIDDSFLQTGSTYFLYAVEPEQRNVAADDGKVAYEVSLDCHLATTRAPDASDTVTVRKAIEDEFAKQGFIVRFMRSSFDPDLKLYLFRYRVAMEVA